LRSLPAGAFSPPGRAPLGSGRGNRNVLALQALSQGVILVAGMVGFCGSRDLPAAAADSALVSRVGSVLAGVPLRDVAVGCAVGGDALVLSAALALGASSRLRVFAAFGSVSPSWPAARVFAPGASSSVSSVSGVAGALAAGASVSWWAGGGPAVPLAGRLASRSAALVSAVAASGAGRGFVGFVSSPCPVGLGPSPSPSACFSGSGSGSWAPSRSPPAWASRYSYFRSAPRPRLFPPGPAPGCPSPAPGQAASASSPLLPRKARSFGEEFPANPTI
jgi:hypothetical protein